MFPQAGNPSNLSFAYNNPGYIPNIDPPPYNRTWSYKFPEGLFSCNKVVLVSRMWRRLLYGSRLSHSSES